MADFLMPSLGADMDAGTLVEWKKKPGERVSRGDIIAEVETEKGIIEVEVFANGVVEQFLVEPGTKVPVGTPLAIIREDGESARAPLAPATDTEPKAEPAPKPAVASASSSKPPGGTPSRASPAARRKASELGLDIAALRGSGPDGAVTLEDVERAAKPESPSVGAGAPTDTSSPLQRPSATLSGEARSRMRHAIAAAMTRSKREVPHYYVSHTVDVTPLLAFIETFNAGVPLPDRIIPAVTFLKAVALGLREFPSFNGFWIDGAAVPSQSIHVGAAIALRGGGLVAPAIRDTDAMSLSDLMKAFRDLVGRARSGTLRSSEMSDPTITVTSLGDRGTESVTGVIYPPQLAIVGFGRILERPWIVGGEVVPRSVVHLSLAADHRATDGHEGALFLAAVADKLGTPEKL